jgi:hypothetical protein
MRRVKSGFAGGSAAKEENRGMEATAAPTALTPVTAKNSLRFSMVTLSSTGMDRPEMIAKRHNPIDLGPCQATFMQDPG